MIYLVRGETMKQTQFNCPVEATLSLIGGKYKPLILWQLGRPAFALHGVTAAYPQRNT